MTSKFFISLVFFPAIAQAELYQCQEYDHLVRQSWPCDAVINRFHASPEEARPIVVPVSKAPVDNSRNVQPPIVSDEERLYGKHMQAVSESEQNPIIQMIKGAL